MSLREEINAIFSKKELAIRIILFVLTLSLFVLGVCLSVFAINNDSITANLYFVLSTLACFVSIFGILINFFTFYLKKNKDFLHYQFEDEENITDEEEIYDITK